MPDVPALPVSITLVGAYLAWFGVHYWESDVKWPSDPIKAVLTGKQIPANDIAKPSGYSFTYGATPSGGGGSGTISGSAATDVKTTIEEIWTANGGHDTTKNIAAAIALAESGGDSSATSKNPDGGTNVGLWQLDTKGVGAGHTISDLQDPNTNARVTVLGSANGTNWSQWETYANGAYKKFL